MTAQAICHGFRRQGLTHIVEWARVKINTRHYLTPRYAFGPGEDAPNPEYVRESKARTPAELLAFCEMVHALQEASWHAAGMAKHFGCSPKATRATMKALHDLKLTRIEEYQPRRGGGPWIAFMAWGPDVRDTAKPAKLTTKQLYQRHNKMAYQRLKQIKLLHAMVRGVALEGRKVALNDDEAEAAA
jgi:hypothetical protein